MAQENGLRFKSVFNDWYVERGTRLPISNGTHPALINQIQLESKNSDFVLDNLVQRLQQENRELVFKFWHSNFFSYFQKFYGVESTLENMVSPEEIVEEPDVTYIFPVEVRTTINSLYTTNTFILENVEYNYTFIDTIHPKVIELLKANKIKLVINVIQDCITHASSVKEFETYLNKHGISGDCVHYICGNTFDSYFKEHPESKVHIHRGQLPLQQCGVWEESMPYVSSLGYVSDCVRESDLNDKHIRSKRFLCFNRAERRHRLYLAYLAHKHNLLNTGSFSFLMNSSKEHIKHVLLQYNVPEDEAIEYADIILSKLPIEIDTQNESNKSGFPVNNNPKEVYMESYVHITSETRFDEGDSVFVTEKTFRPILNLQPFITVAGPHTLKELREEGFKTFHPFIDETYDTVEDYVQRMKLIEKEIIKLNEMPIQELHEWYHSITDILIHNQKTLSSYKNYNPYEEAMRKIGGMS